MKDVKKEINKGLIVSCQALPDEPLHSSFIMGRMAVAALESGAVGIRSNSVEDILEIQKKVSLPIIGIQKKVYPGYAVFITPTSKEMRAIGKTGVNIVACDGTTRKRPNNENLFEIVTAFRKEFPETLLMADCATVEDARYSEKCGFDFIGTTLYGYTEETKGRNIADNDFEQLKAILKATSLPVISEGKIDTPAKARRVLDLGCFSVVVGGAITRPQEITKRYTDKINE